jgi:hypothetical protein
MSSIDDNEIFLTAKDRPCLMVPGQNKMEVRDKTKKLEVSVLVETDASDKLNKTSVFVIYNYEQIFTVFITTTL